MHENPAQVARCAQAAEGIGTMQEWLRGLQENVLDGLDPDSRWYTQAKDLVKEKVAEAWTRYLAEAAWIQNKVLRAIRPSRLSLRTSQAYMEKAEEIYDLVFAKIGHPSVFSESPEGQMPFIFGNDGPHTPPSRGLALARPDETQDSDEDSWPDLNEGCWSRTPSKASSGSYQGHRGM